MCGIVGVVSNDKEVARTIALALYDLQHRGEQAAGIAVFNGEDLQEHKGKGLVTEVFNESVGEKIFRTLAGKLGIGHTLYSTIGQSGEEKQTKTYQPLIGDFHGQSFALGQNGNLIELEGLREEAEAKGYKFQSAVSDTEVIVALLSTSAKKDFIDALRETLPRLKGSFALTILIRDKVIGVRDRYGIRPLCLGLDGSGFILASESCAFYTLRANFVREIAPGEVIVLGENGIEDTFSWAEDPQLQFCVFEYIYFARPDSKIAKKSVYSYRENAGLVLAEECPVKADIIMPVPESGKIYDAAFSRALKIPLQEGLFRNRYYAKRTFLAPRETDRGSLQRVKVHPLKDVVHGRKVCAIEDSVIRANVSPAITAMLREEGATEVHLRVFSPPIRWPCHLGIDMATKAELVAANLSIEEVGSRIIRVDSIGYLSIEGMVRATGLPRKNLCLGCFTGKYPVPIGSD